MQLFFLKIVWVNFQYNNIVIQSTVDTIPKIKVSWYTEFSVNNNYTNKY